MKGWTKIYREQFNSWISKKPFCDGYAWTYFYSQANHKDGVVNFGEKRNEYIDVKRGQFITSKLKLGKIFGWGRYRVNSFINALKLDSMVTYESNNRYILITIENYEKYQQVRENSDNETNNETNSQRATTEQQPSINKNDKNVKNDKKGDTLSGRCALIIDYLNEKTGRTKEERNCFDPKAKSNVDLIRARFNEGRTVKDFITVIDNKLNDWLNNEKMFEFLRPSTLFGRGNFENYVNQRKKDKYDKYLRKEQE